MDAAHKANETDAHGAPGLTAQPSSDAHTDGYEVPVDPHDGVDCEDCQ
ncbi:hypothetical protein GCM10027052_07090 [Parafrigoribacterium mesophilum]